MTQAALGQFANCVYTSSNILACTGTSQPPLQEAAPSFHSEQPTQSSSISRQTMSWYITCWVSMLAVFVVHLWTR